MKKFPKRRVLSIVVAGSMLLSTVFPAAILADTSRTGGSDRFITAVEVAKKGWPSGAENVVLVNAYAPSDAAVAGPLAYKLNAPVLLTEAGALSESTLAEIKALGAKNITLIGGEGVISLQVENDLKALKYSVVRYGGTDRYETAVNIAGAIGESTKAVVVNGEGQMDALAVASWAAANKAPILYTEKDSLTATTSDALQQSKATSTVIIGGEGVISKQVFDALPSPLRYGGNDRFGTATALASGLQPNAETVYVATGNDFADAMVGVGLAAKANAPILYVDNGIPSSLVAYLESAKGKIKNINLLGGTGVVTELQTSVMLRMAGLEADDPNKVVFDSVKSYFATRSAFVTADDFNKTLTEKPNENLVLDIRQPDVYAKSHIKGAINVPYNTSFGDNIEKIRAVAQGKTVTVACYTGQTAGQVASLLNVAGIKAQSLLYGMGTTGFNFGWLTTSYPVVTEPTLIPELPVVTSPSPIIDQAVKDYFTAMVANNQIKAPELKVALETNPSDYLVLDVRGKADFDELHIKGAVNVPWGTGDISKQLEQIQKDALGKTVVVVCYTGQSAGKTTSLLNIVGINAKALAFGMGDHRPGFGKGWVTNEGYEIVNSSSEQVYQAVKSYFATRSAFVTADDFNKALTEKPNENLVLDVRQPDVYAVSHIKGAINVPYNTSFGDTIEKIRAAAQGKTVTVACYTGQTAGQVASLLNVAGIKAQSLLYGMGTTGFNFGWLKTSYPVVTEPTLMPELPAVASPSPAMDQAVKDYFTAMVANNQIKAPDLKVALATNPSDYLVLDIRNKADFDVIHIQGAVNVPWGTGDISKQLDQIQKDAVGKTVVVVCYTGQSAGKTTSLLNLVGIKAKALAFGMGDHRPGFGKGWIYDTSNETTATEQVNEAVSSYFLNLPADSYKIDLPVFKAALDAKSTEYVVLDIRQKDAYDKGHIPGAINVPYGPAIAQNLDKIRALAKDKTLIVACYTGQTAGQTDSLLNVAGIKTRSLNFGMGMDGFEKGWTAMAGYPTVTETTSMPSDLPAVASPNPAIDELVKNYFNPLAADSYKIGLPEMKAALEASPDKYLMVDIRKAADFAAGHIQGAINVPYGPEIAKNLAMLKEKAQGKTMIVYCYTGQTAGQTDSLMNLVGIPTKSLNFGFGMAGFSKGWSASGSGYEIVK